MPRNKYPEETVKKILDVSLKLFLEKGFEKTTIIDIVDNLGGLSRGAIYHHFKSKEEIMDAIMDNLFNEINPFDKIKDINDLNGIEKMRMLIRYSVVAGFVDEKKYEMDKLALPLMDNPRFLAEQVRGTKVAALTLSKIVQEGMTDGSIKKGNAKLISEMIMLFFNIWLVPTIYECNEQETEEKIMLIKQALDALGVPLLDEEILKEIKDSLDYRQTP